MVMQEKGLLSRNLVNHEQEVMISQQKNRRSHLHNEMRTPIFLDVCDKALDAFGHALPLSLTYLRAQWLAR